MPTPVDSVSEASELHLNYAMPVESQGDTLNLAKQTNELPLTANQQRGRQLGEDEIVGDSKTFFNQPVKRRQVAGTAEVGDPHRRVDKDIHARFRSTSKSTSSSTCPLKLRSSWSRVFRTKSCSAAMMTAVFVF
jgi:hypothetical protein